MINVFIGYDEAEPVAFNVLAHSIQIRTSEPVSITPLMLSQLKGVMTRPRHSLQSTDFSFSRFLVPMLSGFEGWSVFMDCDMIVIDDISRLWALRDDSFAVQVVKHSHVPKEQTKFLEQTQSKYEKKNWSSVMVFNNARCRALTAEYVNTASGLELHQFHWLETEALIGDIPPRWNHLVDYDPAVAAADLSLLHYTTGGPYFDDYKDCGYADLWFAERDRMTRAGLPAGA
jgi:hypothetical protein